jgi:hypothetical protein
VEVVRHATAAAIGSNKPIQSGIPSVFVILAMLLIPNGALSAIEVADDLAVVGDVRGGYYGSRRTDRDGSEDSTDRLFGRVRAGLEWAPTDAVSAHLRVAGRYSTLGNHNYFKFFTTIPDADGLRAGDATIDQLFASLRPSPRAEIAIGRFQTCFELAGVSGGSLDRCDSPDTDITWTDGAHLTYRSVAGWNWHFIFQRNLEAGATNVRLPPLAFADDQSRISYFGAVESSEAYGPIVQRAFDVSYLPSSLMTEGSVSGPEQDYIAFVGRLAAQWLLFRTGTKLLAGAELGYAPNTPTKAAIGTGTAGQTGGFAWQIQLSFLDIFPRHSFALQHGRAQGGWLISPDFRNNENLYEFRHEWSIAENHTVTTRIRRRDEMDMLVGTARACRDEDIFVRYTLGF